jgi:hypothetical protein
MEDNLVPLHVERQAKQNVIPKKSAILTIVPTECFGFVAKESRRSAMTHVTRQEVPEEHMLLHRPHSSSPHY